jgi:RNA-directed DNA polymerase
VKAISRQGTHQSLADLLSQINLALRGWTTYFRHGVSKATFHYLNHYTWRRVIGWIRRKHRRANWKVLRRRYFHYGWRLDHDGVDLFDTRAVPVTRYRYRGRKIPTPWDEWNTLTAT